MAFVTDKKKIAQNTIALYVRLGITMVISFFTARVTLEQLGVDDYGLNNLVGSIVSMLSFLNGSMGTAVQRFYSIEIGKGNEKALSTVFGVGLSLHCIIAAITFVLAEVFAIFFLEMMNIPADRLHAAHFVLQISIVSLVLNIINVPYAALLRAREMFSQTAMIEIVQSFMRLGVLYLLVTIDYDKLIVLSFLNLGVTIYFISSLTWLALKFRESHVLPSWDSGLVRQMLSFISMLVITVLAQLLKVQGLVFLINLFFGLAINAAYAVAVNVSNMVNNFITSFKQSVVPQMMASYGAGDLKTMHSLIDSGTKITFLLLMLMSVPVIYEANFILTLWLKTPPEHSAELVRLVLIYINIASFSYFHYQGVHATGKIVNQQLWMSLTYVINVALIYIAFKIGMSYEFAIYINMLISIIQVVVNLLFAHRCFEYNVSTFLKNLMIPCSIVIMIVCIIEQIIVSTLDDSVLRFFLVLFSSALLLFILGYYYVLSESERQKVLMLIKMRK